MADQLTHRLDYRPITEDQASIRVFAMGPACGGEPDARVTYFSETPSCPRCQALPVMATCGAVDIDANGSPAPRAPARAVGNFVHGTGGVSWLIA